MGNYDGELRLIDAQGEIVERSIPIAAYRESLRRGHGILVVSQVAVLRAAPVIRRACTASDHSPDSTSVRTWACRYADQELAEFRTFGRGAVLGSFHYHYARLIEILAALERIETLLAGLGTASPSAAAPKPGVNRLEGVGVSEAPRGTLFHHYSVDEDGVLQWVNLLIATGQNNLAMQRTIGQIARAYVRDGQFSDGALNRIEAGIRAYDPCLSCSTHAVGQMPMRVQLFGPDGALLDELVDRTASA